MRLSEVFGWVSLNFTGGCLAIESTPSQTPDRAGAAAPAGLYASADGEILAVEIESGFAAVTVGQTAPGASCWLLLSGWTARATLCRRRRRARYSAGTKALHSPPVPDGGGSRLHGLQQRADDAVPAVAQLYRRAGGPADRHHADRLAARAAGPPGTARQPLPRDDWEQLPGTRCNIPRLPPPHWPCAPAAPRAGRVPGTAVIEARAVAKFRAGGTETAAVTYISPRTSPHRVIRHILLRMTKWLIKFCAIFIVSFCKKL